jgi:phospholipid-transporting ATPase
MKQRNPNYIENGVTNVNFEDPKFYQHYKSRSHPNHVNIQKVIELLAVCHTIIIDNSDGVPTYNASSPDELALVNAAKFFGFQFIDRDENNNVMVKMPNGKTEKYKLLDLLEFNSTR